MSVPVLKATPEAGLALCLWGWLVGWWFPRSSLTVVLRWCCWWCMVVVLLLQPWSRWPWLHSWYTLQTGIPFLSKKTVFNVALSAWVACGSLHNRIVSRKHLFDRTYCQSVLLQAVRFHSVLEPTCPPWAWTTVLPDYCLAKNPDKSPNPEVSVVAFL